MDFGGIFGEVSDRVCLDQTVCIVFYAHEYYSDQKLGSGKTTLTALISSDHPQSYSLPIKVFGRSRLPIPGEPGISIFDLQKRIGSSSPELHAFFPKHLTIRQVLESAWAETPLSTVHLTADIDERVSALLRWFQGEICPDIGPSLLFEEDTLRVR